MLELVMTVCLLAAPGECRKERIAFDGPLFACAFAGQVTAAEWIATHPKWHLTRWTCGPAARDA